MQRGQTMKTTCIECDKPCRPVKYAGKGKKGMWWNCEDGHSNKKFKKEIVEGKR